MSTPRTLRLPPAAVRRTVAGLAALELDPPDGPVAPVPLLLVPGFTGSKEDFLELLEPLADRGRRAVAVDLPGQYESPPLQGPYSVAALAAAVLAAIDDLGTATVHLVGHSFGGLVAREVALQRPQRLESLILLSSGPAALEGQRAVMLTQLLGVAPQTPPTVLWEHVEAADPRVGELTADIRDFLRARFLGNDPAGLVGMAQALLSEPDRTPALAALAHEVGLPLLVAHGDADDAWPPAVQAAMAERLGAHHSVIPGAVHSPAVEATAWTAELLARFCSAAEAARSAG
jgi:pimeloyl-ACP methyl ester carboxylesterase